MHDKQSDSNTLIQLKLAVKRTELANKRTLLSIDIATANQENE